MNCWFSKLLTMVNRNKILQKRNLLGNCGKGMTGEMGREET
jgi:hypothetical protein